MKQSVLITGGSGLLALNLALAIRKKYEVTLACHKRQLKIKNTNLIKIDLQNYKKLFLNLKNISPNILIHTAGLTNIENCESSKKLAHKINVSISSNVSKVCKDLNIPLVHISTDQLFDGKKSFYTEKDKKNPVNLYATTKSLAEENILKIYPKALIIRTNFFGWGTYYRESFSDYIINNLKKNIKIKLFDDVYYTPILIEELSKVIFELIIKKAYGIYNICGNERISKYEFGRRLAKIFKLNQSLITRSSLDKQLNFTKRPKDMSLSNKKTKKMIRHSFGDINKNILTLKKQKKEYLKVFHPFIPYGRHHIDNEDIKSVQEVVNHGWLTQGPQVNEFEKKISKYVGAKFAVSVTSCTAGLHLAMIAAKLKPGDIMVTSPITFVSTANSALFTGCDIAFADIDKESINISIKSLKALSDKFDKKIRAIVPVHFGGAPCEMEEIKKVSDNINATVIEDAAHALGSRYKNGKRIGCCENSSMTVFSFHPVKAIATGEGGIITTNDREIYKKLLRLRSHGINKLDDNFINKNNAFTENKINPWYYEMQSLGFNYRLNDIQCTLGISQLKKLNKFLKKRKNIVKYYDKKFSNVDAIKPIQKKYRDLSGNHLYIVRIKFNNNNSREKIMKKLLNLGIGSQVHYIPIPMHPYYSKLGFNISSYPNALDYYNEALSLPLYYDLTKEEQDKVINSLKELVI